ncbi:MAG: hypothetical protein ACM3PY_07150 [Omnitrophica WOR_2 bacterium]
MPEAFQSPHAPAILGALQWQRRRNDCGPYTTATVMNALCGTRVDGALLARQMARPAWRGWFPVVRRIPNWATFPWGIADVLRRNGLDASWRFFASPEFLLYELCKGQVLMAVTGSWRPLWAHVMTLLASDPLKGWGFANTQRDDHQMEWVDNKIFVRQWRAMGNLLIGVKVP